MRSIILLTFLALSKTAFGCSCVDNYKTPEEIFSQAVALHSTVVEKTDIVSSADGRATLEVRFKVLSTIKGEDRESLEGNINIPFPTKEGGKFVTSGTSCDTNYYVGQEVFIAIYSGKPLSLGFCSNNILMPGLEYWRHLIEVGNANKLKQQGPAAGTR